MDTPTDDGDNESLPLAPGAKVPDGSGRVTEVGPPVRSEPTNATHLSAAPADRAEPYLDLVRSIVGQGHRVRVLFNTLHFRPERETFHEFLRNVVLWTLGEDWWKHQIQMPETN